MLIAIDYTYDFIERFEASNGVLDNSLWICIPTMCDFYFGRCSEINSSLLKIGLGRFAIFANDQDLRLRLKARLASLERQSTSRHD